MSKEPRNGARLVMVQIVIFAVIAVGAVGYSAINLFGLRLIDRPYTVTVQLASGGGIFVGSNVTYRGVQVGQVTGVALHQNGVTVTAEIDHGQRVPQDSTATVTRLSAVGEQYLNLSSSRAGGPYLHAGSVIPLAQTAEPPDTAAVLANLDAMAKSLDPQDISKLGTQLNKAFGGSGQDLQTIASSGASLIAQLNASSPLLAGLVAHSNKVLSTLAAHADDITSAASSALRLSSVLNAETPDLISLIPTAARSAQLTQSLTGQITPSLTAVLANLSTFASLQAPHLGAWNALVNAIVRFERLIPLAVHGGGLWARALFDYTQPICSNVSQMTNPLSGIPSPLRNTSCQHVPAGTLVRGAQNAPK